MRTYETADLDSKQSGFESGKPNNTLLEGAANDLLVYDGRNLYLRNLRLDRKDLSVHATRWPYTPFTKDPWEKDFEGSPLVCTSGFLDDSLFDRSGCILNQRYSARKLTFNDKLMIGFRWESHNATPGRLLFHEGFYELGRNQYTVFAKTGSCQSAGRPGGRQTPQINGRRTSMFAPRHWRWPATRLLSREFRLPGTEACRRSSHCERCSARKAACWRP